MDCFCSAKAGDATSEHLNAVRLYLGVTTLPDITNDADTMIESWALSGVKWAQPTIPWPNQERPSDGSWIVCPTTSSRHRVSRPIRLEVPLGHWLTDQPYTTREFYYNNATDSIINYNGDGISRYMRYRGRVALYHKTETLQFIPKGA
eukprot:8990525-Ditylum_brightwellii.AAC.1